MINKNTTRVIEVLIIVVFITSILFLSYKYVFGAIVLPLPFNDNMTIDCIRMFYSDTWNKGHVEDLAAFCRSNGN